MVRKVNRNRLAEGRRKNPIQEVDKIKQSLNDIDFLLQSTGKSNTTIWDKIHLAIDSLDDVKLLLEELP